MIAHATVGGWLRADRELVVMLHTSYLPWNTCLGFVSNRLQSSVEGCPICTTQSCLFPIRAIAEVRSDKSVLKHVADLASVFGLSFGTFVCEGLLHFSHPHRPAGLDPIACSAIRIQLVISKSSVLHTAVLYGPAASD